MNTKIVYMYRDASNYKQYDAVVFEGEITDAERAVLKANMHQLDHYECYTGTFLPEQVGLPSLLEEWDNAYDDDHPWHEMQEVELTSQPAFEESIHEFVARFNGIEWDEKAANEKVEAHIATHSHFIPSDEDEDPEDPGEQS